MPLPPHCHYYHHTTAIILATAITLPSHYHCNEKTATILPPHCRYHHRRWHHAYSHHNHTATALLPHCRIPITVITITLPSHYHCHHAAIVLTLQWNCHHKHATKYTAAAMRLLIPRNHTATTIILPSTLPLHCHCHHHPADATTIILRCHHHRISFFLSLFFLWHFFKTKHTHVRAHTHTPWLYIQPLFSFFRSFSLSSTAFFYSFLSLFFYFFLSLLFLWDSLNWTLTHTHTRTHTQDSELWDLF